MPPTRRSYIRHSQFSDLGLCNKVVNSVASEWLDDSLGDIPLSVLFLVQLHLSDYFLLPIRIDH